MPDAITPTRIIPAGTPLPARASVPPPRQPPPPAPPMPFPTPNGAPGEPPTTLVIREIVITIPPAAPEPPLWSRITGRLHLARTATGTVISLTPLIHGHSITTWWANQLIQARHYVIYDPATAIGGAWILALTGIAITTGLDLKFSGWRLPVRILARAGLCAAVLGTVAMANPFDIVTALTGVTP